MARPSFGITEYLQMAQARDLEFCAEQVPGSVKEKTLWRCKHCGTVLHKSYHYLKFQVHGCRCQNGQNLPLSAYQEIGRKLGITYMGLQSPRNIFEKVRWMGADSIVFEACYRDLAYERLPIFVRNHVKIE